MGREGMHLLHLELVERGQHEDYLAMSVGRQKRHPERERLS